MLPAGRGVQTPDRLVDAVLKVQRGTADLAGLETAEIERLRQARSAR